MSETAPVDDVRAAIEQARGRTDLLDALRALYAELDAELAQVHASCAGCGRCCDFEAYGHRLYASTAELALLSLVPPDRAPTGERCPYQVGAACGARDRRTLGCRIHFCRGAPMSRQNALYEWFHERIRSLHQSCCTPYVYADAMAILLQLFAAA